MAKFGLITEGITDQIVIENILCGFYKDEDLDEEIIPLEPPRDETDNKQAHSDFGLGWTAIFSYLSEKIFRDDVLNSEYVIIQIDTDIAEDFDCSINQNQTIEDIIECSIKKLIEKIDEKKEFYEKHKNKIIFAISVHSLECWILPLFKDIKKEEILNCVKTLNYTMRKLPNKSRLDTRKNYNNYDKLSHKFLKYKELIKVTSKNKSFEIFINNLPKLNT